MRHSTLELVTGGTALAGLSFDDMGGLTLNLMNAGVLAGMFGADAQIANNLNVGLFELNISRHGLNSRFGTGGIDVSRALYDIGRWGVSEISRRMAERNVVPETQQHWLPEDLRGQIPDELFEQLRNMEERPDWLTQEMWVLMELHRAAGGGEVDYSSFQFIRGKPEVDDILAVLEHLGFDDSFFGSLGLDTPQSIRDAIQKIIDDTPAMALPGTRDEPGRIFVPDGARRSADGQKALKVHELEHLAQYGSGDTRYIFERLIHEAFQFQRFLFYQDEVDRGIRLNNPINDPYETSGYLEYAATVVEQRALDLLRGFDWRTNSWQQPWQPKWPDLFR